MDYGINYLKLNGEIYANVRYSNNATILAGNGRAQ
jgi:hypothetical protein